MNDQRDELLATWLAGTWSLEDARATQAQLAAACRQDPLLLRDVRRDLQMQVLLAATLGAHDGALVRRRVRLLIDHQRDSRARVTVAAVQRRMRPRRSFFVAIAAAALLMVGIATWWAWPQQDSGYVVVRSSVERALDQQPVTLVDGERIRCPDGSEVIADGGSTVQIIGSSLHLHHGQIQALVAPRRGQPFAITTAQAIATAHGTRFDLRAEEDGLTWLGVAEGTVGLARQDGSNAVLVAAGDQAVCDGASPPRSLARSRSTAVVQGILANVRHPPGNPRGWFNADEDFIGVAGIERFRLRLRNTATALISSARSAGADAVMILDIEGSDPRVPVYPRDPRLVPLVAPEMDACADGFFAHLADAGLATGVGIGVIPWERTADGRWIAAPDDSAIEGEAAARIAYARQRWGCTVFHLGHNVNAAGAAAWERRESLRLDQHAMPDAVLLRLRARFPDCQLVVNLPGGRSPAWSAVRCDDDAGAQHLLAPIRHRWPWATALVPDAAVSAPDHGIWVYRVRR